MSEINCVDAFNNFAEALKSFSEAFSTAVKRLVKVLRAFRERIIVYFMSGKERHYYLHSKKMRIREKYFQKARRRFSMLM